jgi:TP901 family phage tail tape measure protein
VAGDLRVNFIIRAIDRATAPLRRVTNNFERMTHAQRQADRYFQRAANLRQAGEGIATFARTTRNAFAGPVKAAEGFNYEMSRVRALTGATGADFATLRARALELGASIGEFSAVDAAQGMSAFGMAGYTTNQIMAALPSTLDLATAGQVELGRTVEITTGIMGAFNLGADQTRQVGDVLAATFTGSKTTLESLGETMSYAGSTAARLGVSLEDTAVLTGLLGNASIEGSRAGTALNTILNRLAAPRRRGANLLKTLGIDIEEVVNGTKQMRGPVDILGQIADKTRALSNTKQQAVLSRIFGLEAGPAVGVLISQLSGDRIRELDRRVKGATGALGDMATIMRDNGATATKELASSLQTLGINIGDTLEPTLTMVKRTITGIVLQLNKWVSAHPHLTRAIFIAIGVISVLASILAGLIFTLAAASTAVGVMSLAMGGTSTGAQILGAALKPIGGLVARAVPGILAFAASWWSAAAGVLAATWPIVLIVAAIAAVVGAVYLAIKYWDQLTAIWDRFTNASLKTKIALAPLLAIIAAFAGPVLLIAYLAKKVINNWTPIKNFFVDLWSTVTNSVKQAVEWLGKIELPTPLRLLLDANLQILDLAKRGVSSAVGAVSGIARETAYVATGDNQYLATGGGGNATVGGRVVVEVQSDQPARVKSVSQEGPVDLGVDVGYSMGLP